MHVKLTKAAVVDGVERRPGWRVDGATHPSTVSALLRIGRAEVVAVEPDDAPEPEDEAEPIEDAAAEDPQPIDDEPIAPSVDADADSRGVPADDEPDAEDPQPIDDEPEPSGESTDDRPIEAAGLADGWTEKLIDAGIATIGAAKARAADPAFAFSKIKGIGPKSEAEIREHLATL